MGITVVVILHHAAHEEIVRVRALKDEDSVGVEVAPRSRAQRMFEGVDPPVLLPVRFADRLQLTVLVVLLPRTHQLSVAKVRDIPRLAAVIAAHGSAFEQTVNVRSFKHKRPVAVVLLPIARAHRFESVDAVLAALGLPFEPNPAVVVKRGPRSHDVPVLEIRLEPRLTVVIKLHRPAHEEIVLIGAFKREHALAVILPPQSDANRQVNETISVGLAGGLDLPVVVVFGPRALEQTVLVG